MNTTIERNMGEQPITRIMADNSLSRHDIVKISPRHITHKMVARACKGRRLTRNAKNQVLQALNQATGKNYSMEDLFDY